MKFAASAIAFFVLVGCASTSYINDKQHPARGDLRGMIYDLDRRPVSQVQITVNGVEGSATSDVHGHFVLANLPFGPLELTLAKPEYETFRWKVEFGEVSQVLYVQMADAPQLFDAAAAALEQGEWAQVDSFLDRGRSLVPNSPLFVLIKALSAARQSRAEEGAALLEAYLEKYPRYPVLEVALADLYERELKLPGKALVHLEASLALRYDPEVDLRIRKLKE